MKQRSSESQYCTAIQVATLSRRKVLHGRKGELFIKAVYLHQHWKRKSRILSPQGYVELGSDPFAASGEDIRNPLGELGVKFLSSRDAYHVAAVIIHGAS